MNKNFRIITINGIRGMVMFVFLVFGLIAGFIVSPGWVCMKFWNYLFQDSSTVALMNIYQGVMLWAIIVLSMYALNNKRALIGFGSYQGLSPEQIKDIMQKTKESSDTETLKIFEKMKKNFNSLNIQENALTQQDMKQQEENSENKENTEKAGK